MQILKYWLGLENLCASLSWTEIFSSITSVNSNSFCACYIHTTGTELCFMMTSSSGNIFRVTGPLCGEFTDPGEFPTQRPVTRSFDVFFDLRLNKRLSKQPWGWWFETPSWSLWCYCNVMILACTFFDFLSLVDFKNFLFIFYLSFTYTSSYLRF